jgi:hypothetical protein
LDNDVDWLGDETVAKKKSRGRPPSTSTVTSRGAEVNGGAAVRKTKQPKGNTGSLELNQLDADKGGVLVPLWGSSSAGAVKVTMCFSVC